MQWLFLKSAEDLEQAIELSASTQVDAVLVFKHSTRCSISRMALERLERNWKTSGQIVPMFYLDLLSYRDISNQIAERFQVVHQSPQVLLLKNKTCFYHNSHSAISAQEILDEIDRVRGTQS